MANEKLRQVNVRISEASYQLLDAIAYLEEAQHSPLLRPVLEAYLASERDANPLVEDALVLRAKQRAKKGARVVPLKKQIKSKAKPTSSRRSKRKR